MVDIEKAEFSAKITAVLVGIYGQPRPQIETLRLWWAVLSGYSMEELEQGLEGHIKDPQSGQWPPRPADIRRHIHGRAEVNSAIAWGRVISTIEKYGTWESVCFDDPLIHAAVRDVGGWVEIWQTSLEQLPFLQSRFEKAYRAHQDQKTLGEYPPVLVGAHAKNNALCGIERPPVLIGDEEKAKQVLLAGVQRQGSGLLLSSAMAVASALGDRNKIEENYSGNYSKGKL